jgi:outer membrane protein assembly factor BamD (BamD/ComL family)
MTFILIFMVCFPHTGVVIVDNIWLYDAAIHRTHVLNTGDVVQITGYRGDTTQVRYQNTVGTLLKSVLIDLKDGVSEAKLFVFAQGYYDLGEYMKSASLFNIFTQYYAHSPYLPEVLYYYGLCLEKIAQSARIVDTIKTIVYNEKNNQRYYTGDAYNTIIKKFSDSSFAPKAAFRLITIFRIKHLPWNDSIQLISQELSMWQEYSTTYKNSEERVLALLEIGYLERVLFEITEHEQYKNDAQAVFEEIAREYPNTVYAAQADVNLDELKKGEHIYYH